jgi:hypothetical protein
VPGDSVRSADEIPAAGQGGDPIGGFFHALGNLFNLRARNGLFNRSGDKTHDRNLLVGKNWHRNSTDFMARLRFHPVEMVVFIAEIMLVLIGGVLQFGQASALVLRVTS